MKRHAIDDALCMLATSRSGEWKGSDIGDEWSGGRSRLRLEQTFDEENGRPRAIEVLTNKRRELSNSGVSAFNSCTTRLLVASTAAVRETHYAGIRREQK